MRETETYLVLAGCGVGGVHDLRVRVLRVVALEILVRKLKARLHVGVARVEERGEELDVGLLAVVLVSEETNQYSSTASVTAINRPDEFQLTHGTRLE